MVTQPVELVRDYFENLTTNLEVDDLSERLPSFSDHVTEEEFRDLTTELQTTDGITILYDGNGNPHEFDRVTLMANELSILTQSAVGNLIRMREDERHSGPISNKHHRNYAYTRFKKAIETHPDLFFEEGGKKEPEAIIDHSEFSNNLNLITKSYREMKITERKKDKTYHRFTEYQIYLKYLGDLKVVYDDMHFITHRIIDAIADPDYPTDLKGKGIDFLWDLVDSYHNMNYPSKPKPKKVRRRSTKS